MAALAAAGGVIAGQQAYAKAHDLATLFEVLTVRVLAAKPPDALPFLRATLEAIAAAGGEATMPAVSTAAGAGTWWPWCPRVWAARPGLAGGRRRRRRG